MQQKKYWKWFAVYMLCFALCTLGILLPDITQADASKPLLFVVAGQSNARGTADKPSSIIVPSGAFWNGDEWVNVIRDPVFPAKHGSFCPAMAKVISDKTRRKVYIINVSISGSSSNEAYRENDKISWAQTGKLRKRAVSIYKKAVSALNVPFEFGGVVWLQGETEARLLARGKISLEDAQIGFESIYAWLSHTFGKVFIIGIGYRNGDARYDAAHTQINMLSKQLARKMDDCYFASDMPMRLRKLNLMQDPIKNRSSNPHYLIKGYDLVGEDVGTFIANRIKKTVR